MDFAVYIFQTLIRQIVVNMFAKQPANRIPIEFDTQFTLMVFISMEKFLLFHVKQAFLDISEYETRKPRRRKEEYSFAKRYDGTSRDHDNKLPRISTSLSDYKVPAGGTIALQVEIKGISQIQRVSSKIYSHYNDF